MERSPDRELHSLADDLPPLSEPESEVMGRQTERSRPGHDPAVDTVYGDIDGSVENEGQTDAHQADWKDIV